MSFIKEFKEFAVKGNVIDLAVAVVIGGAFGKIVSSFVNDLLMPILGILLGGVSISGLSLNFGKVVWAYGNFLQAVLDFTIIALAIFIMIKVLKKFEKQKEATIQAPSEDILLLREIRDKIS